MLITVYVSYFHYRYKEDCLVLSKIIEEKKFSLYISLKLYDINWLT